MQAATALIWSRLNVLTFKRYRQLVDRYGDLDAALPHINPQLLRDLGCREETAVITMNVLHDFDASAYIAFCDSHRIHLLNIEDDDYPSALKTLPDPPVFLHVKGDLSVVCQPCMALVGTRRMSTYGKRVTETFTEAMVRQDIVTVSGLALGIDACVAEETLRCGGKTVAVLAGGLASVSPKSNAQLAKSIVESGGLLLSEFPPDFVPDKYAFPARNRIIAGLCAATVVLEAGADSGALITAGLALEYGRDVFAVPGQIFDERYIGCNALIAKGHAQLAQGPDDVLTACGFITDRPRRESVETYVPQNEDESKVYGVLSAMPQAAQELSDRTSLDSSSVSIALTMLELAGVAENVGQGKWVRR